MNLSSVSISEEVKFDLMSSDSFLTLFRYLMIEPGISVDMAILFTTGILTLSVLKNDSLENNVESPIPGVLITITWSLLYPRSPLRINRSCLETISVPAMRII